MIINVRQSSASGKVLTVQTTSNATVTLRKNDRVEEQTADSSGIIIFKGLSSGVWSVTASKGVATKTIDVDIQTDMSITIFTSSIPEFTYTTSAQDGGYVIYDGAGNDITNNPVTDGDWKIKFLKSGYVTFTCLNGATDGIDVFCVGGGGNGGTGTKYAEQYELAVSLNLGGGGGAGGFTNTAHGITVGKTTYDIIVGGAGGTTKAFDVTADGGGNGGAPWTATYNDGTANGPFRYFVGGSGGNGGSGGGAGSDYTQTSGGTDGNNGGGSAHNTDFYNANIKTGRYGQGQRSLGSGTTTKEFGESTGTLYASGGKGGLPNTTGSSASPNTGNGGAGGGHAGGGAGGSGVVVIRNKRT